MSMCRSPVTAIPARIGGWRPFRIEVSDTGIGISQEAQKRIFDKFTQADASTTRKFGGTGLGLAICKQLVGMMGGEMGLTSQLDIGTTFWFTIKLRRAEAPSAVDTSGLQMEEGTKRLVAGELHFKNVHVMVAEDNPVDQELAASMLKMFGCKVTVASNGEEVLKKTGSDSFDLILMDCEMPEMNGYRAARILTVRKNTGQFPDIPIVAVISSDEAEVHSRCMISGMTDFLAKPMRKEALAQMLLTWLPAKPHRRNRREDHGRRPHRPAYPFG